LEKIFPADQPLATLSNRATAIGQTKGTTILFHTKVTNEHRVLFEFMKAGRSLHRGEVAKRSSVPLAPASSAIHLLTKDGILNRVDTGCYALASDPLRKFRRLKGAGKSETLLKLCEEGNIDPYRFETANCNEVSEEPDEEIDLIDTMKITLERKRNRLTELEKHRNELSAKSKTVEAELKNLTLEVGKIEVFLAA
jgi:hypothetical protein